MLVDIINRVCHIVGFAFGFGYLLFFRTASWFGLENPLPHTNAIQLILTLKVVSVTFDVHDAAVETKTRKSDNKDTAIPYSPLGPNHQLDDPAHFDPSILEFYCYVYCFIGLFTGPFYQLKLYRHMIHRQDLSSINTVVPALRRLACVPIFAVIFVVVGQKFPDNYMMTDEFLNLGGMRGFTYRFLYIIPVFLCFRLRFYIGWLIAESACISSALGAYPLDSKPLPGRGPTVAISRAKDSVEMNSFYAIQNIDIYNIEVSVTMAQTMRHWNMTVQTWLVYYVYKRFPVKGIRYHAVFLVTSFWHGVHPGYYLCFLSTTIYGAMETRVAVLCKPLWEKANKVTYGLLFLVGELYRTRAFEYVSVGFILLDVSPTLAVWRADYFYYHIFGIVVLLATFLVPVKRQGKGKELTEEAVVSEKKTN